MEPVCARTSEALAANRVPHPATVRIFDYGQLEDGRWYLIMDLLEGATLGQRHRQEGLSGAALLRLCGQVAGAMAAAHAQGIVHRDLKPDNIMVVKDQQVPGGERARVLDFGIARLKARLGGEEATQVHTSAGLIIGTPSYMAPEQCRGAEAVDGAADVYSLGVILYELLCGETPFRSEKTIEVLFKHVQEEPPPLRERNPLILPEVAGLVHAMLAKEPAARPTMAHVAAALDELAGGRVATPLPPLRSAPQAMPPGGGAGPRGTTALTLPHGEALDPPPPPRRRPLPPLLPSVVVVAALVVLNPFVWGLMHALRSRPPGGATADLGQLAGPRPSPPPPAPAAAERAAARPAVDGGDATGSRCQGGASADAWYIESSPTGAEVVEPDPERRLGTTPCALPREGRERRVLRLWRAGYRVHELHLGGAARVRVRLQPLSRPAARPVAAPTPEPGAVIITDLDDPPAQQLPRPPSVAR